MKAKIDCILDFLKDVAAHNDRGWFAEHKGQYEEARGLFEEMVQALIHRIATFDGSVAHLTVKDCTYRFIATPVSRKTNRLISVISEPISTPAARSPGIAVIISTFSPANACWPVGHGVCLRRF